MDYYFIDQLTKELPYCGIWNTQMVEVNQSFFLNFLSKDEMEMYDRYKQKKSKIEFLGGRVLLKLCLSKMMEEQSGKTISIDNINVKRKENGAPYLVIGDEIQEASISIAHRYDYIFCGCHPELKLGLDVEKVNQKLKKLKNYYIDENEQKLIDHLEDQKLMIALGKVWTSKESLLKWFGGGHLLKLLKQTKMVKLDNNTLILEYKREDQLTHYKCVNYFYDEYVFSYIIQ